MCESFPPGGEGDGQLAPSQWHIRTLAKRDMAREPGFLGEKQASLGIACNMPERAPARHEAIPSHLPRRLAWNRKEHMQVSSSAALRMTLTFHLNHGESLSICNGSPLSCVPCPCTRGAQLNVTSHGSVYEVTDQKAVSSGPAIAKCFKQAFLAGVGVGDLAGCNPPLERSVRHDMPVEGMSRALTLSHSPLPHSCEASERKGVEEAEDPRDVVEAMEH